jgi:hypothetical protein
MKRVSPRQHLRIDERFRTTDAESCNMHVMIDETRRVDVVESALDEVGRFHPKPGSQLFRLFRERPADGMDQTHLMPQVQSSSFSLLLRQYEQPKG